MNKNTRIIEVILIFFKMRIYLNIISISIYLMHHYQNNIIHDDVHFFRTKYNQFKFLCPC